MLRSLMRKEGFCIQESGLAHITLECNMAGCIPRSCRSRRTCNDNMAVSSADARFIIFEAAQRLRPFCAVLRWSGMGWIGIMEWNGVEWILVEYV